MNNHSKWIVGRIRAGWIFLTIGLTVVILGVLVEMKVDHLPFDPRILTGLGILFIGIGAANLIRYRAALKNKQTARRLTVEEHDERNVLIRSRAGNRAYWVSAAFIYIGLMWASFSANGSMPALAGDTLWFFLVAGVLVPFGVYITSILIDQQNF